ncbi:MAG: cupin domain-containing protein [Clostridiaceae bacterium]|jgi:mannose-6-phosphate isomerase-like protein (cupin superfamily)|nr:cupin domain-containing protein [Clostridiaceae bacterium]
MLKRPSEMTVEIREKMRGGNGNVKFQNIFNPDEIKGKCRLFSQITLEPGCSIGSHVHDQEEEIYYILSGTGTVNDNGVVKNVGPGDAIKTGDGESHSISNNGDVPLVFLAVIILF